MLFKKYHKKPLKEYDQYMDKKYKDRPDKDNIFGVGLTDSEFRHFVINIILGEDWWAPSCTSSQVQVNEEALESIITELGAKPVSRRKR